MDAVDRFEKAIDAGGGKKAASDVLAAASAANTESRPSVGLGIDLRFESEKLVGFALVHEGQMVHICIFQNGEDRKPGGFTRVARHSDRRQRRGF
jgi:hypothetical protein